MKTYKLYAVRTDAKSIEAAMKEEYTRILPGYALIYSDKTPECKFAEVKNADLRRLTKEDERWLLHCNARILAKETAEREPEILKKIEEKINLLEKALREEREKGGIESE